MGGVLGSGADRVSGTFLTLMNALLSGEAATGPLEAAAEAGAVRRAARYEPSGW
jgi:hypothetical protein